MFAQPTVFVNHIRDSSISPSLGLFGVAVCMRGQANCSLRREQQMIMHWCASQTRPQEATFLASLLQHQPAARPTVDALLRSNLLPALHASLASRRGGAAVLPAPSSPISAASVSPAAAKLPSAPKASHAHKGEVVTSIADSVQRPSGQAKQDGQAAAKRREAVAAAAEDKEVGYHIRAPMFSNRL